jgi:REP element-mobilizing transposase RayT
MPRIIRGDTAQRIFHALNRGVERRNIFLKAEDYGFFMSQAREVLSSFGISLLSYCLMPNHFHFLAAVAEDTLSRAMHVLESRYSMYFNRVYERVGHLFQDRFKAFEVADEEYLSWLPVYIHRNPVKARLAQTLDQWQWSGHAELMSDRTRFLDLPALSRYGYDPAWFQASYREWAATFGQPLGADATLQQALVWCSMACGVRWQDVRAGARGGPFTDAKRMLVEQARIRGYTLADVASFLDCTRGALNHLFER